MEDAWALACPCTGGKRPRSPVEKLADLQGSADEGEAHWRSSKRFFTEVISSGFSKLTFGRALQQPGSDGQQGVQVLSTTSPKGHAASTCYVQLPGALLSPRDDAFEMDMQTSPNMRQSPGSNRMQRPPSLTEVFAGQAASPVCSPAAANSVNHSPMQYPFGSCSSPSAATCNKQLPPPAWQLAAGCVAAAAAVPQALPKVLKAAEKPPNSPSDLPSSGSNLRKVALLRSLLARTEQHLQQHQLEQQHQQLQEAQQQESGTEQQQQQQHSECVFVAPHLQGEQQQQELTEAATMHSKHGHSLHDMHRSLAHQCSATACANTAAGALPQAYPTAKPAQSDDMDCSSSSAACSSFADSDSSEASGGRPVLPDTKDLAATSLLCTEVLPFGTNDSSSRQQQQERQFGQHRLHVSFAQQVLEQQHQSQQRQPFWEGHAQQPPGHSSVFGPQAEQPGCCPGALCGAQSREQQAQHTLQQQLPPTQAKPPKAPETLTRDRLEALRAKALANTSKLTDLEPEDLHSFQLSIAASKSRRGSADHTPSHLHTQTSAEARRHSSHI